MSIFEGDLSWECVIWLNAAKEVNEEFKTKTAIDMKYCLGQMTALLKGFFGCKEPFNFITDDNSEETDETIDFLKKLEKMHG